MMFNRKLILGVTAAAAAFYVYAQQGNQASYYENTIGRLSQQVRSMQDENAMLAASNADLKRQVARLESEVRSLSADVAALRKQIAADAEVRRNQMNRLADKLTENARKEKPAPPPAPVKTPKDNTEYVEHEVEKGTTLNALAKAYQVSVKDIMKANNMKKPNIYAGQKLLIPVSSKR